jgi:N-methylhydantoinase A
MSPAARAGPLRSGGPDSARINDNRVEHTWDRILVGVDIGGTFTDCVVLDRDGRITATKSPSTPGNFAEGMLGAMSVAAERLGHSFREFCEQIKVLTHGTTVGTNALIQRKGAGWG